MESSPYSETKISNKTKRILLFLFGCMGARLALAWFAYAYSQYLPYMGIVALIPAAGFLVIYFGGLRKTGPEVFGEKIWWNDLRPVHGFMYALFAVLALLKNESAWIVLLADAIIGLVAFVGHHLS